MNENQNEDRSGNSGRSEGRPAWKKSSDSGNSGSREGADRPRGSENARGERPARAGGDRDGRPRRDGERSFGDRPRRHGERSYGDRPRNDGDRPRREGDRPTRDGDRPRRDGERSFGDRPRRDGDRNFGERPGRGGDGRENRERPEWQQRVERTRDPNRPKSPMLPDEITEKDLDLLVRVQFKTLSPENSERVSRHLAMVNLLINQDPELAHQHALAAADRAGRIGVVRETLGLTAYTVGDYALALRELQAYRRISGANDQLPIMVDCERGLGRPDKALELGRSVDPKSLEPGVRVNLAIALSGARLDRNENDLALAELEIAELNPEKVFDYSPQLFWAYSDTLEILGRDAEAKRWGNLAERAEKALAAKNAPAHEVMDIIEEIEIPEPYESKKATEEGAGDEGRRNFAPRAPRRDGGYGDRDRRDGDRPRREGGYGDRPRRDGDAPRGERSRRDGERPYGDRPRRDGDAPRGDRPYGDHPRNDRPRNDRPNGDRPGWKPKRDD